MLDCELLLRFGELTIDLITRRVTRAGRPVRLRARELDVLAYLIWNRDRAVTTIELRERVWSLSFDPETNSVAVHMSRLRDAMDRDFDFPMIRHVKGEGYRVFDGPAEEGEHG